ncbi:di-N-acetylchitobiase [Aplysia californica]|uniref:Di-N-acetylchitobiase n=1 Tax=Aplysia californica TaxID=6500 RepID=A0ABM0JT16_APLCA|nr:di-N-acetylchitobiase [Aplysia californica]
MGTWHVFMEAMVVLLLVMPEPSVGRSWWMGNTENLSCPCSRLEWCQPISTKTEKEVFAFSLRNEESHWELFDWSKLTTVVMFGYVNQSLMCLAHSHGVRAVILGEISTSEMVSPSLRKEWVKELLTKISENFLDGVNFDYENEVLKNETMIRDAYTSTVRETNDALKAVNPNYQVSVDVAWKPNVDSRFFDYPGLANASDFLFVMAYDEQSQIFGECVGGPNSDLRSADLGLEIYMRDPAYRIAPSKLVLGLPWYGYSYECIQLKGDSCFIKKVPFRGVNCSDAAGRQYDYGLIYEVLMTMPERYKWNASSSTPYFTYTDEIYGTTYQVQFDDPHSLSLKCKLAKQKGLRGVGMWNIDSLDYTDSATGEHIRSEMFGAFSAFL